MSGFPRDLAVLEPWELSLIRSRERRAQTTRGRTRATSRKASQKSVSPNSLSAILDVRNRTSNPARPRRGATVGSLAGPLARSPPRHRAALRAGQLTGQAPLARRARGAHRRPRRRHRHRRRVRRDGHPHARARDDDRTRDRAQQRQRRTAGAAAPAGARLDQSRRHLRPGNRSGRPQLPVEPRPHRRRDRRPLDERHAAQRGRRVGARGGRAEHDPRGNPRELRADPDRLRPRTAGIDHAEHRARGRLQRHAGVRRHAGRPAPRRRRPPTSPTKAPRPRPAAPPPPRP